MQIPRVCLKSQSLKIDARFDQRRLEMISSYECTIWYSEAAEGAENKIDTSHEMDLCLYGMQMDIQNIKLILPSEYRELIEITRSKFLTPERQAISLQAQKPLKIPCSYLAMMHSVEHLHEAAQEINIYLKFKQQLEYQQMRDLEDNFIFKIQISYVLSRPVAGLRFLDYYGALALITEKHIKSSRSWMPVPQFKQQRYPPYSHQEKELLHYSKIIVICPLDCLAIVSGTLTDEYADEVSRAFVFKINEFVNPDDLGVFIAPFKSQSISFDDVKLTVLHHQSVNVTPFNDTRSIFEKADRFWYKDGQLSNARKLLNIESIFGNLVAIVLPNIFQERYFSFYPFKGILVFDELQIPTGCPKQLEEFHKLFTLQLNMLSLTQFLAPSVKQEDKWIPHGFAFQISFQQEHYQLHNKLLKQCRIGQDVLLESSCESLEQQLKTRQVINMLASVTHQQPSFVVLILKRFYQDYKGCIPQPLGSSTIFETIKSVFAVKGNTLKKMFVKSMGAWKFKVHYEYSKDHKLILHVKQQNLLMDWAHNYTVHYIQQLKSKGISNDMTKHFDHNQERAKQINRQIHNIQKDRESQFKEEIRKQKSDIKMALVPVFIKAPMYFSGTVRIHVYETNELKLECQNHEVSIKGDHSCDSQLNCPQKLKKYNIPKRHLEINAQSYLEPDIKQFEGDDNNIQPPMVYGILGEALMKSGAFNKKSKELSGFIQKDPQQWIRWDPEGFFIKEVEFKNQDEVLLLCQIMKEKDLNQISTIMRTIRNKKLRAVVIKMVIEIIETSFNYLESYVIIQLLDLLSELVNRNCLKEQILELDDISELQLYLRLCEKLIYKYFFNQTDNSLKYYRFNTVSSFEIVIAVLKGLRKLITTKSLGFHHEFIELFYTILRDYDNSQNSADCSYLNSQILKLILNTNCTTFKYKIHSLLLHLLKVSVYKKTKNYILRVMIINYDRFVEINYTEELQVIDAQIQSILKSVSSDQNYILMAQFKCQLMKDKTLDPGVFLLKYFEHLADCRLASDTSVLFHNKLLYLQQFLAKNYKYVIDLSSSDLLEIIAGTAFEQVITGISLLNNFVLHCFANIYRTLFYYFAPLSSYQEIKEKLTPLADVLISFPYESVWMASQLRYLEEERNQEQQSLQQQQIKRSRPVQKNIDSFSYLKRFAQKNPNKMSEKELVKQILKILAMQPAVKQIEDQYRSGDQKQQTRLEQVRASMKRKFSGMDILKRQTNQALQYYNDKGQLENGYELIELTNTLFSEAIRLIDERRQMRTISEFNVVHESLLE